MADKLYSTLQHIAIVMDGNGRWAKRQNQPRVAGHRAGVKAVESVIKHCVKRNIAVLSLFAFSSENWRRPDEEISVLMDLFSLSLKQQAKKLHKNNIRLRIIGDISQFSDSLQDNILRAEKLTAGNSGLLVNIAANYGGRWDVTQSVKQLARKVREGKLHPEDITEDTISAGLTTTACVEPDLFIRTGGEKRVSNFLLWQMAYTEFYFTDTLWPDFDEDELDKAIKSFCQRERRFGKTSEQLQAKINA